MTSALGKLTSSQKGTVVTTETVREKYDIPCEENTLVL